MGPEYEIINRMQGGQWKIIGGGKREGSVGGFKGWRWRYIGDEWLGGNVV